MRSGRVPVGSELDLRRAQRAVVVHAAAGRTDARLALAARTGVLFRGRAPLGALRLCEPAARRRAAARSPRCVPRGLCPNTPHHDGSSILAAIKGGIAYTRRDPGLRAVMIFVVINSFLAAPFIALVPAMAIKVFDRGAGATSFLVTAQGIGAVTMALSLGAVAARFGSRRTLFFMLWSLPFALALYAIMPTLWASGLAIFLVGLLYLGALSSFMSIAQLRAPAAVRGRG